MTRGKDPGNFLDTCWEVKWLMSEDAGNKAYAKNEKSGVIWT